MSKSRLTKHIKTSPNRNSPRQGRILGIAPHCVVGQMTTESALNFGRFINYDPIGGASCNYLIATDGTVICFVDENDRSWCTSGTIDNYLVTIECASDAVHPYKINDKVKKSLIQLMADICYRNGIEELLWKNDKTLMGQWDKQNIVLHRWTANKACPGDYIVNLLNTGLVEEVNVQIETLKRNAECPYSVRTTIDGVRLFDKLGGKVVKRYAAGVKLNVVEVRKYKGYWYGKGKKTRKWFRLKHTEKI